ncbi:hypothetical protein DENSPDRAFT_874260 [Dentipellis sp. KUC8613]|nr:hypothetical protein DENSPDRAFT_874260 [Dentipellis sp. KUC8613]
MNLHVSRGTFMNTVLRDDSGEPRYRIETSFTKALRGRETIVSRFLPGADAFRNGGQSLLVTSSNTGSETDIHLRGLPEEEIATIEWHRLTPTLFKWLGRTVEVGTYMPYKGALWRKRAFTATDGQSYVWTYGIRRSYLARDDDTHACIARYHRRSLGLIGESRKAYLEISPDGTNIADEIVVTFVYIERRREQRRRRRA